MLSLNEKVVSVITVSQQLPRLNGSTGEGYYHIFFIREER